MDGLISDFEETVEAIIDASDSPLSILIVGVGDEDFHQLEYLDSDGFLLQGEREAPGPDGKPVLIKAKRDIVQFVNYGQLSNKDDVISSALGEIPDQICSYFRSKLITPAAFKKKPTAPVQPNQPVIKPP